jgi:hypothetical protein
MKTFAKVSKTAALEQGSLPSTMAWAIPRPGVAERTQSSTATSTGQAAIAGLRVTDVTRLAR